MAIGAIALIVYENHHILVKVYGNNMYYFVKEGKDRDVFPRRHKVELPELLDYIVKYHRNVEPRLKDMT